MAGNMDIKQTHAQNPFPGRNTHHTRLGWYSIGGNVSL